MSFLRDEASFPGGEMHHATSDIAHTPVEVGRGDTPSPLWDLTHEMEAKAGLHGKKDAPRRGGASCRNG